MNIVFKIRYFKMITFTKSLVFAAEKHQSQRRKQPGDIPYINHPLEVTQILSAAGITDWNVLTAAVLHDTLEDTQTTVEELIQEFGEEITKIVVECTDDKSLGKVQRKINQIYKGAQSSPEARLVKVADKISNNRSLLTSQPLSWTPERVQGYFIWSQTVCDVLKGNNEILDKQISEVFQKSGINVYSKEIKQALVKNYYEILGSKND